MKVSDLVNSGVVAQNSSNNAHTNPKNIKLPAINIINLPNHSSSTSIASINFQQQQMHQSLEDCSARLQSFNNNAEASRATTPVSVHSAPSMTQHEGNESLSSPVRAHSPHSTISSLGYLAPTASSLQHPQRLLSSISGTYVSHQMPLIPNFKSISSLCLSPTHHDSVPIASMKASPPSFETIRDLSGKHTSLSTTQIVNTLPTPTRESDSRAREGDNLKHSHYRNASLEPPKRFICQEPGCGKSFTRRYNLSAHLRCHRSEKPFACGHCDSRFARKHDLTRHVRSLHELKRSFGPCPTCGAYFTRSDALSRHLKVEAERKHSMYEDTQNSF